LLQSPNSTDNSVSFNNTLSKIRREFKDFLIYGFGNISQSLLGFLLLPVYMGYFSPEQYGIISILYIVIAFTGMVASAGLMSALHMLYFTVGGEERKALLGSTYVWHLVVGILCGAIIMGFSKPISNLLFLSTKYQVETLLIGLYFLFNFALDIPFNIFRLEKKSGIYVSYSLLRLLLDFGLKILLIIVFDRGVRGYLESGIISTAVTLSLTNVSIVRYIRLTFRTQYLRELLKLGFPFIFSGFAMWSLTVSDRLVLNYFVDQNAVGIFATGMKFSQIFKILLFTTVSLFLPAIIFSYAENHSEAETKRLLAKLLNILVVSGGCLFLLISIGTRDLIHIMVFDYGARQAYLASITLVPVLTIVPFLHYLTFASSYALLMAKKPIYISYTSVICALLNLLLNFALIPQFKEMGAAIATAVSYSVYVILIYYWAGKQYPAGYSTLSVGKALLALVITFILWWSIPINSHWIALFARPVGGLITFLGISWFLCDFLTKDEKTQILISLKQELRRFRDYLKI
jgi:O-antigen/teichoic acid export membrane protein